MDPVAFRLGHLSGAPRMARVLKAAVEKSGWVPKPPPARDGVGVALGEDAGTCVATIAEVKLDRETGEIRVTRVVCAQDMGMVVSPEGALQQLEGCVTMGLGYTLGEELSFEAGKIDTRNFPAYRIPRFSWVPRIEGVILPSSDLPPQGGGEPAIVTVGAAVANAVCGLTGARLTQLPMTAERVKAALPT